MKPKGAKEVQDDGAGPRQLFAYSDFLEFTNEPENAQKPQYYGYDYDSIQDRLNGARHWDVRVDKPEKHTNYDQNQHHVD